MAKRICMEWGAPCFGNQFTVQLMQRGKDNFTVTYGKQVKEGLDYGKAALELGACIMHALACDGLLDNRHKNER